MAISLTLWEPWQHSSQLVRSIKGLENKMGPLISSVTVFREYLHLVYTGTLLQYSYFTSQLSA